MTRIPHRDLLVDWTGALALHRCRKRARSFPCRARQGSVCTTTSTMPGDALAQLAPRARSASRWASVSETRRPHAEREEHDAPGVGRRAAAPAAGRAAGALAHEPLDLACGVQVGRLPSAARAVSGRSSGSRCVCTSATPGRARIACSTRSAISCGLVQVEVGRELQVQRHAGRAVLLEDRDVVRLLDERLGQRDREHPVAQVQAAAARLDVHDHVAAGQRPLDRLLDQVGRRGGPRRRPARAGRSRPRRRSSARPTRAGAAGSARCPRRARRSRARPPRAPARACGPSARWRSRRSAAPPRRSG